MQIHLTRHVFPRTSRVCIAQRSQAKQADQRGMGDKVDIPKEGEEVSWKWGVNALPAVPAITVCRVAMFRLRRSVG